MTRSLLQLSKRTQPILSNLKRSVCYSRLSTHSDGKSDEMSSGEQTIYSKLKSKFDPSHLEVKDVSGGCGSMYSIQLTSAMFQGKSLVQQHRLVNEALKDDIKSMHGLQLKTSA